MEGKGGGGGGQLCQNGFCLSSKNGSTLKENTLIRKRVTSFLKENAFFPEGTW